MKTRFSRIRRLIWIVPFVIGIICLSCNIKVSFREVMMADFYVASDGNDMNPGTEKSPFATISRARDAVQEKICAGQAKDILILIRGGIYKLPQTLLFGPEDSGKEGYFIIYAAYPNEVPVFEGGQLVIGWTLHDSDKNIYKANVGSRQFRQLYVDGKRAVRARTPSMTDKTTGAPFYTAIHVKGSKLIVNSSEISNWDNINQVECVWRGHWMQRMGRISSFSVDDNQATLTFMSQEATFFDRTSYADQPTTWYHFENAYEFLDAEGEWYLNTSQQTLYYKPRSGEDISSIEVISPLIESIVTIAGTASSPVHHLMLKGITFQHSNWSKPSNYGLADGQAMVQLQADDSDMIPGAVNISNANNIRIENNTFRRTGSHGLLMKDDIHHNVVTGNTFTDLSAGGIYDFSENSSYNTISYNLVENFGEYYTAAVGILAGRADHMKIEHNTVRYGRYTGISFGWSWDDSETGTNNNQIRYNLIHSVMQLHDDGAGIYSLGRQSNSIVSNNYIYGLMGSPYTGSYPIAGIYQDAGSCYITVEDNVVDNTVNAFYARNPPNHNNLFQNNYYNIPLGHIYGTGGRPGHCFVPVSFKYNSSLTPFVAGQNLDSTRNNYTGWVGMKFTVGFSPIAVKQLGRWVVSGNRGTHTVKIVDASGSDVASVDVSTSEAPVGFKYVQIPDVVLSANTSYFLVSSETDGGDSWHDGSTTLTTTGVAIVTNAFSANNNPASYLANNTVVNNTYVSGSSWPSDAAAIMADAGFLPNSAIKHINNSDSNIKVPMK